MRWFSSKRRSVSTICRSKLAVQRLEDRATPAAIVTNVTINSMHTNSFDRFQRSRVTDVAVTFDSQVTFVGSPSDAFTLNRVSPTPGFVAISATVNNSGVGSVVTLTFTGGAVQNISLADGRYALHALAAQFSGSGLDGNGDGVAGDDFIFDEQPAPAPLHPLKIFRMFGDINGDGTLAASDFLIFRLALGGTTFAFDGDNDGAVAVSDLIQFKQQGPNVI